ncbi:PREDICTED: protein ENHANCED DISEASE RESISTANCE 2-like [Camelina sativa]|uniref:Protein ENHANCED DISEASE RESISTANCE 2-like n=1 Tax=Camelina sativa TaxID=90675 RepID=A0ABM0VE72_CAMSA|nr:PREDICTED: protein ENHANCED DISEASE RESISTANCE 2-like [Camelina sativa]
MNQTKTSTDDKNTKPASWTTETINGGSFRHVDLNTGTNGWSTPPGNVFPLRSQNYFTTKQKTPGGDYLLSPAGVDWLKSTKKLDHVLSRPDNRVAHAIKTSQSPNSFIFAVNLQTPTKEHFYSLVLYFATQEPVPSDSLLHKLINGEDDTFRDERLKIISNVVKGPWVVKAAAGKFGAFVAGKALKCSYYRGANYFEIDVDISSSAILTALVRFMLGYVTNLTIDIGFVVEAQTEDELPERLIGGVRICHMELASAFLVDDDEKKKDDDIDLQQRRRMMGAAEGENTVRM